MKTVWVGIDCGKSGGVAAIFSDDMPTESRHTPTYTTRKKRARKKTPSGKPSYTSKTTYDLTVMWMVLNRYEKLQKQGWKVVVGIEAQRQRQRDSKQVVFQCGRGMGLWEMAVTACGLQYELVQPSVWKPKYLPKGAEKEESRKLCLKLYPEMPLPLAKDEARAEATLIADYLMRRDTETDYIR